MINMLSKNTKEGRGSGEGVYWSKDVYIYMCVCLCVCVYAYVCLCSCVYVYVCVGVCVCVCVCVCLYSARVLCVCVCVCVGTVDITRKLPITSSYPFCHALAGPSCWLRATPLGLPVYGPLATSSHAPPAPRTRVFRLWRPWLCAMLPTQRHWSRDVEARDV